MDCESDNVVKEKSCMFFLLVVDIEDIMVE